MAFASKTKQGVAYTPGWFLADNENCTRLTMNFKAEDTTNLEVKDGPNGSKYVPMGSVYKVESTATGVVYEDVDVSNGEAAGSVVTEGIVYKDRLTTAAQADVVSITGITVVEKAPTVTRPEEDE